MTHITTTGTAILFICCVGGLMALGQTPGATVPSTQSSAEDPEEIAAELGPRHPSYHDNPDELRRMRVRGQQTLRQISDVLLENVLDIVKVEGGFDLCLTEIIRRGGAHWEEVLKTRYAAEHASAKKTHFHPAKELLLLTAVRRVEKKPDPLVILIEGKSLLRNSIQYLPEITANLTNLDGEKLPIPVDVGGDYRGASRHNKWRIQLLDEQGRALPEREEFDMGGLGHSEVLEYAESIPLNLRLASYISIQKPGRYTATVLFHPTISIGLTADIEGLICCKSIPLTLVVEPITVRTSAVEQARAASLILKLPAQGPVKILGGAYNEKDDFLAKGSAAAQLRQMDWKAVPELIAAVNSDKLNPTQRAWALGLLFGISDQYSPIDSPGIIGPFEYRHSGWISLGGPGSGRSVGQESMLVEAGTIDEKAQIEFARCWKPWMENEYIKVIKTGGDQ
ncbi:MAG TPA: hypothetical protein VIM11_02170 [Tepidisphaeraceae bacterium]|jgi:hypothetical protein